MANSAEQIHNRNEKTEPQESPMKLFVDLDVCSRQECKLCTNQCSYFYHVSNNGITSVRELVTYALVCRRCEEPHCVNACPTDALEQQKEKQNLLMRHNMRCISCKSCSHACPYGTIFPELVPFLIHNCDFCLDRRNQPKEPVCIPTCPFKALSLKNAQEPLGPDTFAVGGNILVHSTHWQWEKA
jgi:Fe-S-cluster-containing dehydrogenase component